MSINRQIDKPCTAHNMFTKIEVCFVGTFEIGLNKRLNRLSLSFGFVFSSTEKLFGSLSSSDGSFVSFGGGRYLRTTTQIDTTE